MSSQVSSPTSPSAGQVLRRARAGQAAFCLGALLALVVSWSLSRLPVHTTGYDMPDAAKVGNVEAATIQMRQVLDLYRSTGWDFHAFSRLTRPGEPARKLLTLPDAKYAEARWDRDEGQSFTFAGIFPEHDKMAFRTEIYLRKNLKVYKGDRWTTEPSGFLLVAWKDGRVERVPWQAIRQGPTKLKEFHGDKMDDAKIDYFPGMPGYSQGLPRPSWADPNAPMRRK